MILSNKNGIQNIVLTLHQLGLREVVICPGSRNAPLVISFNRHPDFNCTSIRDERSAGFFALGKALATKQPVALLCTSGSAALNFAPAIVEAFYQRVPLIVITADRPKEWVNQGDGQTINQENIYNNYINASYELKGDSYSPTDIWMNERSICEGYNIATVSNKGPIHFNVPIKEPLYGVSKVTIPTPKVFIEETIEQSITRETLIQLSEAFNSCKKVMILVGQMPLNSALQEVLSDIAALENVVVLTESTSNLHHPLFVENIDRCITGLSATDMTTYLPDLLITIGGEIISKRIKKQLRNCRPKLHWNIHPYNSYMDTYQSLTSAIPMKPHVFLNQLFPVLKSQEADYSKKWQELNRRKKSLHDTFCQQSEYSDFNVFRDIYKYLPQSAHLHISNSSPIRYAQLFDNKKVEDSWCNRGTSGIDGSTSTAMGAAASAPEKQHFFITGDVAFHYDINALWNDIYIENLNIIVINNSGGGIFRIIEGPNKIEERSKFLETSMNNNIKHLATHFKWNYLSAHNDTELAEQLKLFFDSKSKRTILEIFTDADKNPVVLNKYWEFLNKK